MADNKPDFYRTKDPIPILKILARKHTKDSKKTKLRGVVRLHAFNKAETNNDNYNISFS